MKTIQKFVYAILFASAALILPSCIRLVPQAGPQGYNPQYGPQGQQGQPERSFKPYYAGQKPDGRVQTGVKRVQTGTKQTSKFIGGFTVQLWDSEDMGLKEQAHIYTEKYFRANGTYPTDDDVSEQIGHKCRLVNKR